ncbi:hypothetical protein MmiHf6_09060 [Methanimicrococcus hongohii]|uniref:Uncharacterized protein n=1 Tax=Methanimicrococcus hongohii TaxID=3028295 RepID=A0AA96VAW0_9EURY|nr:hypothetical protein [Methanimicrococcus sp. Hf6]WNY23597.1 hypothetical protein MmiHf6_09060 [Methanimicrococcus sp. Hf6]
MLSDAVKPAGLQLSFTVSAAGRFALPLWVRFALLPVSAHFNCNPLAFASVPPPPPISVSAATYWFLFPLLPTGLCFRCHLPVSVSAATYGFRFPLLPSGFCCRCQSGFCFRCYLQVSVAAVNQVSVAAAGKLPTGSSCCRRARTAHVLKNNQKGESEFNKKRIKQERTNLIKK